MAAKKPAWTKTKLKKDFKIFLAMIWHHLMLPVPSPIQNDIADYLQIGPKRIVIEAFRGIGKSWITSAFVLWCLYRDPQIKVMVVSANKDRATAFSTFTKRLIGEIPELNHLKPDPEKDQRDSVTAFDVGPALAAQAPSVYSVGIFGQLTGSRASLIVADDVEVPKNSYTQGMREKLSEAIKEFSAVLLPGDDSRIVYLGTPQTEESIYNKLTERGFVIRAWPARYPNQEWLAAYADRVAPYIKNALDSGKVRPGDPTDPDRFTLLDLAEREGDYGRTGFALQFMLDTRLSDDLLYPLKLRDLIVFSIDSERAPISMSYGSDPKLAYGTRYNDPDYLPTVGFTGDRYYRPYFVAEQWQGYQGSVMTIDPAGRGKDETGYAVIKNLFGRLYLTASGGLLGGYDEESLKRLACIARDQRVNEIIIEGNFGDGMFTQLFRPVLNKYWACTITEIKSTGQKELRIIDTLEPVMNQHKLVVSPEMVLEDSKTNEPVYSLFYQMTRITKERGSLAHDDRLEAVAMAVAYWQSQMGKTEEDAHQEHRDQLLEQELENFMALFGVSSSNNALTVFTGRQNHGATIIPRNPNQPVTVVK